MMHVKYIFSRSLVFLLFLSCGTEKDTDYTPISEDPNTVETADATSTSADDLLIPPSPVTGAYLSCQKMDVYTYCRIQSSYADTHKIEQNIKWDSPSHHTDIEYLEDDSQWHIRIESQSDVAIHATLDNEKEFSYFHKIDSTQSEEVCPPYTSSYQGHCLISSGRNSYTKGKLSFSNLNLENQDYRSFKSYLPYPMIYADQSLEVDVSIDWNQGESTCNENCDVRYVVFLMRQNSQKNWIKRSYLCFEPDLFTSEGKFYGTFIIPDIYSVYYVSQPIPTTSQCSDSLIENMYMKLEAFGAILPE